MPSLSGSIDGRQQEFLTRVQEDATLQHHAEILEGDLNLLKEGPHPLPRARQRRRWWNRHRPGWPAPPVIRRNCISSATRKMKPRWKPQLEDYLFDQGLEVCLPAFDVDDAEAAALHQENLMSCDGVLIFYGAAPKAWVDIKLRELLKAAGYGRETPITVQGIYIAPPDDRRKERFRSHQASVIHQPKEFVPSAELDAFVSQIKEGLRMNANPFPGLRAFRQEEDYLFFGREEQTVELLQRLGSNRFVTVVGTSGSGKSSLVRCGLLSELLGGKMREAGASWEVAVTHPGGNPLALLADALLEADLYDIEGENAR